MLSGALQSTHQLKNGSPRIGGKVPIMHVASIKQGLSIFTYMKSGRAHLGLGAAKAFETRQIGLRGSKVVRKKD